MPSIIENLVSQFEKGSKNNFSPAKLVRLDQGEPSIIEFQFQPESFSRTISSNYASGSSMNRAHPIIQFTNGELEEISFSAQWYSRHKNEDIQPYMDAMAAACRRDPNLGRPPIWAFLWGIPLADQVVVKSIAPINIESMKPDGSLRHISFSLTLLRYEQYDIQLTDPNERPHDTFYIVVQTGDTWESLAARQYGDALKGDLLRRLNPARPFLVVGERVKLLDADRFDDVIVTPDSPPLQRTAEGIRVLQNLYVSRSASKVSLVVKV